MALSYTESSDLMNDFAFRGRVKVAALHFADYVQNEPPNTPAHTTRWRWASDATRNPDQVAMQIQPSVVMQSQVQEDGAAVTDENLQIAVETVINQFI